MDNEKKHILLVDDDPVILTTGRNILSDTYQVSTVESAEKMFEFLKKDKPHLILLDINMPTMNGYDAIKKIKEIPETKDIPIVFLTGNNEVESKLQGYALGAVDYITKPFDPSALLSRIFLSIM